MKIKNRILSLLVVGIFISTTFLMYKNVQAQNWAIDVYSGDDICSYSNLHNAGVTTIVQKVSEGCDFRDSLLDYRYNQIISNGFKIGYYHFLRKSNPILQAQFFLNQIGNRHNDMVLWLDVENESYWTSKFQVVSYVNQFLNYLKSQGKRVGLYTSTSFFSDYLAGNIPSDTILWLASYGRVPHLYPNIASWQYTETGNIAGAINGNVDMDYFLDNAYLNDTPQDISIQQQEGNPVRIIQEQLNTVMSAELTVDGIQGKMTTAKIKEFEVACGLNADGIWGCKCANAMATIYSKPICGRPYVNRLATRIIQFRMGIKFDGIFGRQTEAYVKNYQARHGLNHDGIVGNATWSSLLNRNY
ncbi:MULTISPECIES: GH25 family lysozyme [Clostridium]|uniref:GH25 family lysozyme n=1 Tax=Clostridium TaxID=1485 RepID=UPI0008255E08|nr:MULTISPECIES: GH25 family lysozyme [Clostridium]